MSEPVAKKFLFAAKKFTNAQILALPTTALEVVPAAGPGEIIVPVSVHLHIVSSVAYTNIDPLLAFQLIRGTVGQPIMNLDWPDLLLGVAVNTDANMILQPVFDLPADIINKPLNLYVSNSAAGNLTGGASTNTLTATVGYYLLRV